MEKDTPGLKLSGEEMLVESGTFCSKTRRVIQKYFQPLRPEATMPEVEMLEQAHRELLEAQNLFSVMEEPELIDCAIYALKSAELRYNYLIRQIKQKSR
ncbi:MAG: DUF2508 family protein [Syntrophomonadaceae bacterium]|nr:DUF2508 family protein [Syntrophomonadaceae bacterium]